VAARLMSTSSLARSEPAVLILDVSAACALAVAILVGVHGGLQVELGSTRLSAHGPGRALLAGGILLGLRLLLTRELHGAGFGRILFRVGLGALLAATLATWLLSLVPWCGGADSYGYVSASRLLRSFRLSDSAAIASYLPVPDPLRVAAPLGYVPAVREEAIVPGYPLGLPLVMAAFAAVFGDGAEFYVSPVVAAGALAAAFGIARAFADVTAGWLSAFLLAITPILVNQAVQPMSDTAATFWLLLAFWLLVRAQERQGWWLAAGAAAGMVFLTRPVLLPATVALLGVAGAIGGRRAAILFCAAFAPFVFFQGWLHWRLYGSILASGYGSGSQLFAIGRLPGNFVEYFTWLNYSMSPVFLITFAAALFGSTPFWLRAAVVVVFSAVAAPYLFYFTYDDWQDTRFLLPGMALAVILCGITIRNLVARWASPAVAPLVLLAIAVAAAVASYRFLDRHHTLALARVEARYPRVAEWIDRVAPERTVVLALLHSGSVRFYAGRPTARWDQMTSEELAAAIAALSARGWNTWAVVDGPAESEAFWPRVEQQRAVLAVEPKERIAGVDILALRVR